MLARSGWPIEVAILLVPAATLGVAMVSIRAFRLSVFRVFLLRPAPLSDLVLSVPVALALFVVSDQLANLSQQFVTLDEAFLESLDVMVRADGFFEWVIRLAGIGFGAAISEELLFRGVILTGLGRFGRFGAICISALLFTVMHGLLLPNHFVAGVVLGIAAAATGSILVPISIHFFHNTAALLLFNLGELDTLGEPLWTPAGILIPAILILAIGVGRWMGRLRGQKTPTSPGPDSPRDRAPDPSPDSSPDSSDDPPDLPRPPPYALAIGEDLKQTPTRRRRLGLVVLATATAGGVFLSLGLFLFLGYVVDPETRRAAAIAQLRQVSHEALGEGAAARGDEIDAAFDTLGDLNRDGRLRLPHIFRTTRAIAGAIRDGEFGEGDVEDLLTVVGGIRGESPPD